MEKAEMILLEGKLKSLSEKLRKAKEMGKNDPTDKSRAEEISAAMFTAVLEIGDIHHLMKETGACCDHEMLCESWRKYAVNAYTKLIFSNLGPDSSIGKDLMRKAFLAVSALEKAVNLTYEEFISNRSTELRIADIYYATLNGLNMEGPGLFFAHNNSRYDVYPVRISAFITGMEHFWDNNENKEEYLYSVVYEIAKMSLELLKASGQTAAEKAADIIHDYGDYISHAVDVYKSEYSDFCIFAMKCSALLHKAADMAVSERTSALKITEEVIAKSEIFLSLVGIA